MASKYKFKHILIHKILKFDPNLTKRNNSHKVNQYLLEYTNKLKKCVKEIPKMQVYKN